MRKLLFILLCVVSGFYLNAQESQEIEKAIFTDIVFAKPNPPKSIKGWEMVELENNESALVGEYPGKIIKFQFRGDAVGIEVETTPEAGIIEYSIDASEWKMADLYTPFIDKKQTSLFYTLGKDLKNRKHTLQIRLIEEKNTESAGNKCIIRRFYYNAPE